LRGYRLAEDYLIAVVVTDIERFEGDLPARFSQWPSYPEPVQEGLFDMAFKLGIAGLHRLPRFLGGVKKLGKGRSRVPSPSLDFCTLGYRFGPFYKGLEEFSRTRIQRRVAENPLLPAGMT
jgi:hypothetical protein